MLPFLRIFVNSLLLFNKYHDSSSVAQYIALLSIATSTNLESIQWSEIAWITLPSACKLMHLDADDHQLLSDTYQAMYPEKNIQASMVAKYQGGIFPFTLLERKLVRSLNAGLYDQQESWLQGQEIKAKLVPRKQSDLAL